jgi:tetratricopeptide (TPR) repeat protein
MRRLTIYLATFLFLSCVTYRGSTDAQEHIGVTGKTGELAEESTKSQEEIIREVDTLTERWRTLHQESNKYQIQQNFKQALTTETEALELINTWLKDPQPEGLTYHGRDLNTHMQILRVASLGKLGKIYRNLELFDKAETSLNESLILSENIFGADSEETAERLAALRGFYYLTNNKEKGEPLILRELASVNADSKASKVKIVSTTIHVADFYLNFKEFAKAEQYFLNAKSLAEQEPPVEALTIEQIKTGLHRVYVSTGREQEARAMRVEK